MWRRRALVQDETSDVRAERRGTERAPTAERVADDVDRRPRLGRDVVSHAGDVLELPFARVWRRVGGRLPSAPVDRDDRVALGEPRTDHTERGVVGGRAVDK